MAHKRVQKYLHEIQERGIFFPKMKGFSHTGPEQCGNWGLLSHIQIVSIQKKKTPQRQYSIVKKISKVIGKRELDWLLLSPSTHKVYCFNCCLFVVKK